VAARDDAAGGVIVVLLADTGERYITTDLFSRDEVRRSRTGDAPRFTPAPGL
jgi:hypothetical protein